MPSFSTRTLANTARRGASSRAVVQVLGRPRAGPARPPQMLGAASSIRPSHSANGPHDDTPTADTSATAMPALAPLSPTSRMICRATASCVPSLQVGSLTRPRMPCRSAMLTATLVPPMSIQATGWASAAKSMGGAIWGALLSAFGSAFGGSAFGRVGKADMGIFKSTWIPCWPQSSATAWWKGAKTSRVPAA